MKNQAAVEIRLKMIKIVKPAHPRHDLIRPHDNDTSPVLVDAVAGIGIPRAPVHAHVVAVDLMIAPARLSAKRVQDIGEILQQLDAVALGRVNG